MLFRCFVLTATAAGFLAAADSKDIRRSFPLDSHGHVTIDTYKGSIRVSTWDRNEIDVAVRIEEDGDVFAQSIRYADVRFDASASDLRITSNDQWSFFLDGSPPLYHYTIRMPRAASLRIKDYKSETDVSDLAGEFEVNTYKGSVQLRNHTGGLMVNTYKGEVRADFAAVTAPVRIETYKGSIDLRMPRESRFDLSTDLGRRGGDPDNDFARYVRTSNLRDRVHRSQVNGGGPEVRVRSYKGEFRLRAR
ncbi:MAG: DUF4097 family beta strand repeat-containing protein [Acidobacteriia bacterium]|nr:DUF4097 family beta strand repeat-containing protein [Terriglobia bacterium]